jgi:hypothetical protein
LANALASGSVWVPTSRIHRSLDDLLTNDKTDTGALPSHPGVDADTYLHARAATLDTALLSVAEGLAARGPMLFAGGRLRFPKDQEDGVQDDSAAVIGALYVRITDLLDQVNLWTGFAEHFTHVSAGLPPTDMRAFMATLIAEATNLGLSRMAEISGAGSRRALLRMQMWHIARRNLPRRSCHLAAASSISARDESSRVSVIISVRIRRVDDGAAACGTLDSHSIAAGRACERAEDCDRLAAGRPAHGTNRSG